MTEMETAVNAEKPVRARAARSAKKTVRSYKKMINDKKKEAHDKNWLYIELCAKDLIAEAEDEADNIKTVCRAMMETMLEGDGFIREPRTYDRIGHEMTVRYYCDNLDPSRAPFFEN